MVRPSPEREGRPEGTSPCTARAAIRACCHQVWSRGLGGSGVQGKEQRPRAREPNAAKPVLGTRPGDGDSQPCIGRGGAEQQQPKGPRMPAGRGAHRRFSASLHTLFTRAKGPRESSNTKSHSTFTHEWC